MGLVDPLFPAVHTVHTIHGRATAVAAGAVLADGVLGDGRLTNVVMIGDGGATIGLLHLTQAALMNVDLTVLLHNNMLYGMTGGQHSALTPEGSHTSTTPAGNWVPALDLEPVLRGCQAGFFARHLATDAGLTDAIAAAIAFPGFALVEVLELCTVVHCDVAAPVVAAFQAVVYCVTLVELVPGVAKRFTVHRLTSCLTSVSASISSKRAR